MTNEFDRPEIMLELIDSLRKAEDVTIEQMTYGLCERSLYAKVLKNGNRRFDKLMIDAFFQRLGKNMRNFECLLDADEYHLFELREKFRDAFFRNDLTKAEEAGKIYAALDICKTSNVHRQMAELFEIELLLKKESNDLRILEKAYEAIRETIPGFALERICDFLYSEVELVLLDVILSKEEVLFGKEKVYPFYKSVYEMFKAERFNDNEQIFRFAHMMYRYARIKLDKEEFDDVIRISGRMIQGLVDDNKIHYLAEFLECKGEAKAGKISVLLKLNSGRRGILGDIPEVIQARTIKAVFEKYYSKWDPENDIQIYWELLIFSTSKIIKQRRISLGLTQEELCWYERKEICSVDTVSRLENGTHKINLAVERMILKKLNLSGERYKREYVTSDYSELCKLEDISKALIIGDNDKIERLLDELENSSYGSLCLSNRQYIGLRYATLQFNLGKDHVLFLEDLRRLLRLTLGKVQNSNKEIALCMFNTEFFIMGEISSIYKATGRKEDFFELNNSLVKMYREIGITDNPFYYNLISLERAKASELGNQGQFDESDAIAKETLTKCLRFDRLDGVMGFLYCLAWNNHNDDRKKMKDKQEELRTAFVLAELFGKTSLKKKIVKHCQNFYSEDVLGDINHE